MAGGSGTVRSIATGAGLTGGTITTSGTISATYVINAQTGTTYTVLSTDASKLVTFSNSGAIAVTLPQATGSFAAGFAFDVQNLGAGAVTITPTTSTINGGATLVIPQNYGCSIVSDGTNWQVSQCTAVIPKATASAFGLSEPDNVTIKATAGVYADQYPTSGDIMVSAGNGAVPTGIVPGTGVATALANNLSAAGGVTSTIASGTAAMGTGAISSATCATVVTVTAINVATTDTVLASFNGDPTAVTGYTPATTGMLTIISYPTSGNVNFKVCNNTSSSITPGAITLNWRVVR